MPLLKIARRSFLNEQKIFSLLIYYFENHKIDLIGCYDSNFDRSSQLAEKFETSSYDENYLEVFNVVLNFE